MLLNTSNLTNSTPQVASVNANQQDTIGIQEPSQLVTFRRVLFSFVIILALVGNSIVIRAIRMTRSSRKPFTHYLVTCLAVAEIMNSLFLIFIFVQEEIYYWPFGSFLCHIATPGNVVTFSVTTVTLVGISLYRYNVLVTPYKKTPSRRVCLIVIGIIWVYSFAFSMPLVLTTKNVEMSNFPGYYYCMLSPRLPTYSLVRSICQFFIPVAVMFITYTASSFTIKEHLTFMEARRQIRINSNISTLNTYIESQGNGCDQNFLTVPLQPSAPVIHLQNMVPRGSIHSVRRSVEIPATQAPIIQRSASVCDEGDHMIESERDIIKMFYVIVLIFLLCYIPYQVFFMLDHFMVFTQDKIPYYDIARSWVFLLTTLPSALHPLCYGTMSRFYARAFSKIVLCKCMK